jgi:spore germination cell wall hydrolase CwlJ-like protein
MPTRAAFARVTGSFVAFSVAVGMTIGGAYLAGALARHAISHAKIERLAGAVRGGFSESALEAAAANDGSAMTIARRLDPTTSITGSERDERLAAFADRLQARADSPYAHGARDGLLAKASYTVEQPYSPPALPFDLRGALDESRDLECLTQAVYYEARGESVEGQAAVAQVVLNRTRHPAFPKTVCGVVFQGARNGGCQFSFACDGSVHRRVEPYAWRRAEKVAAKALDGFVMPTVGNATHFHVANLTPDWGPRLMKVAQVGAHVFYRFAGRSGSSKAFTATPLPSEPLPAAAPQPVYASLALSPIAGVATAVANTVAGAASASAELVLAAASPKANAAVRTSVELPAKAAGPVVPAPAAPAAAAPVASAPPVPAPSAALAEPVKPAA